MEASGDLVALALELAAGVELGHDDLDRGAPLAFGRIDRDAAAVVPDGDGVVGVDGDVDAVGEAGEGLVDGVVHDLDHQVVQAAHPGGADVHAGAAADAVEALQDGDVLAGVAREARPAGGRDRRRGGPVGSRGRGVAVGGVGAARGRSRPQKRALLGVRPTGRGVGNFVGHSIPSMLPGRGRTALTCPRAAGWQIGKVYHPSLVFPGWSETCFRS